MRQIFVNLPTKDLEKSKAFFVALGFSINPQFTNEDAASVVVDENIFLMLHTPAHFTRFVTGEVGDPAKATSALYCLSAASREEVDELLSKALAAGAKPWQPAQDYGFMYLISFQDLDGHVWEIAWMDMAAMSQG